MKPEAAVFNLCVCLILQVVGHLFAYTVAYDLVAESEDEKSEVSNVVDDIVGKHGARAEGLHSYMCLLLT